MKTLIAVALATFYCHLSQATVIAVIDSGVDINHPEISKNLWRNDGEFGFDKNGKDKSINGIDDDRNGYVDDHNGWDFVLSQPAKIDPVGHGTHITGIILKSNKGHVATKIMSLRYYAKGQGGDENLKKSIAAIRYAVKMGADIINYSGGGPSADPQERAALLEASRKNILVVAAAGNESRELGFRGFYPATYGFSNILSVASTNSSGEISQHSNFGKSLVHLAAFGENVESTLPGNRRGTMSGTSQATAAACGVAAHLISKNPLLKRNPQAVIVRLMNLGRFRPSLSGKTASATLLSTDANADSLGSDVDAFGKPLAL